ncbi:hypothetical protein Tco_0816701 [Tanacetum coccineum]
MAGRRRRAREAMTSHVDVVRQRKGLQKVGVPRIGWLALKLAVVGHSLFSSALVPVFSALVPVFLQSHDH